MENNVKNYGLLKDIIKPEDYFLGGGFLPQKTILNESGDWSDFLPVFEYQASKFETWGCTCFGTLNCLETLIKKVLGTEYNFSERFPYIGCQIREPGASPHTVIEWIRDNGLIAQSKLPMTDTYEEFIKPDPLPTDLLVEGQHFLNEYDVKHEWVFLDKDKNKKEKIKQALKYSPLGISVHAWKQNGMIYFKSDFDDDNHWVMLFKIDDKGYYHIFDTYDNEVKVLDPEYNFDRAKVYFLFKRTEPRNATKMVTINLMKTLLAFLKRLLNIQLAEDKLKKKTMNEQLAQLAKDSIGIDVSPRDFAPDDLACAESVSTLLNKVDPSIEIMTGTYVLYDFLNTDSRFERIMEPVAGCVVVSPTGLGNGVLPNGHTGIYISDTEICSNSSATGLWTQNYTRESWRKRYYYKGGFPVKLYKFKS